MFDELGTFQTISLLSNDGFLETFVDDLSQSHVLDARPIQLIPLIQLPTRTNLHNVLLGLDVRFPPLKDFWNYIFENRSGQTLDIGNWNLKCLDIDMLPILPVRQTVKHLSEFRKIWEQICRISSLSLGSDLTNMNCRSYPTIQTNSTFTKKDTSSADTISVVNNQSSRRE